jgi:hypothetical protein
MASGDDDEYVRQTNEQVLEAAESLAELEELTPTTWSSLTLKDKLKALQVVEDRMASLQGRPGLRVVTAFLNGYGECDINNQRVVLNHLHLLRDRPVDEIVNTVIHEGRHAYQYFAVTHAGVLSDTPVVASWAENLAPGNYLNAEQFGQELYESQPVELDAWDYADRITQAWADRRRQGRG